MTEKNTAFSPFYKNCKFYRNDLRKIAKLSSKTKYDSYAFFFICLLSQAICEDVDGKGLISHVTGRPQTYIETRKLAHLFGVKKRKKAKEILHNLKNNYGVIDYVTAKKYSKGSTVETVYIHFNAGIVEESLAKGTYAKENTDAYNTAMAVKNNDGFFLVNKNDIINTFYSDKCTSHGVQDLYVLLWLNSANNIKHNNAFENIIPQQLNDAQTVIWKLKESTGTDENMFSVYCRQSFLSNILNVSIKTIQRFIKTLKKADIIKNEYLNKRGTIIAFCKNAEGKIKNIKETIRSFIKKITGERDTVYTAYNRRIYPINYTYRKGHENIFQTDTGPFDDDIDNLLPDTLKGTI